MKRWHLSSEKVIRVSEVSQRKLYTWQNMIQGVKSEPKENMKYHCFDFRHLVVLQDAQIGKKFFIYFLVHPHWLNRCILGHTQLNSSISRPILAVEVFEMYVTKFNW